MLTSLHHLWFLPLCLWVSTFAYTYKSSFAGRHFIISSLYSLLSLSTPQAVSGGGGGMRLFSFVTSSIFTTSLAIYCRIFTPFSTYCEMKKKDIYMNINGCYEFWKVSENTHLFEDP